MATIVFVHGAWVTPSCWTKFRGFFEDKGIDCLTPPWPFLDRPIADLRSDPDPRLAQQTIRDLVDHHEQIIRTLPEPPILIGHSFGGLIVQLLLDRGLGRAGVAIDAGPPRGVLPRRRAIRSALPVLLTWRGWNQILTMSFKDFSSTFANGLPVGDRQAVYDQHIVPAPGRIYFQAAFGLGNAVNFKNPDRGPLLLVAGENDRTSTVSMVKAMYRRHSRSPAGTQLASFPGRSHWLIAEPGWDEVAQRLYDWMSSLRATHGK
ncbi:MAG: hypothetical protein QOI66_476 [Myxococcales bacterium]|jgi:pimeloyl-ACP methyl ester carboxylesterase|nr:hypothetical protein [Myxococcales bacterium]